MIINLYQFYHKTKNYNKTKILPSLKFLSVSKLFLVLFSQGSKYLCFSQYERIAIFDEAFGDW